MLLPDIEVSEARILGDRVTRNVSEQMQLVGAPLDLSFGVAAYGEDGLTLDELTQAADRGLYAAKRATSEPEAVRHPHVA